jgi:hypothetical protein
MLDAATHSLGPRSSGELRGLARGVISPALREQRQVPKAVAGDSVVRLNSASTVLVGRWSSGGIRSLSGRVRIDRDGKRRLIPYAVAISREIAELRRVRAQTCVFRLTDDYWTQGPTREPKLASLRSQWADQRHDLGPKSRF